MSVTAAELLALGSQPAIGLLVALAVGSLIGLERERRRQDPAVGTAGGLRTHAVVAVSGALATLLPGGSALLIIGGVFVAVLVVLAYWRDRASDRGITSEVTLFTTYLLGAVAMFLPQLAAGVGVVLALALALRKPLHHFARETLSEREWLDVLLLFGAVAIVYPLMPDRALDASGALNLRTVWQLTVLVLLINAAGYVLLRALGPRRGLPLAGLFGGFISSSATVAVMGVRFRESAEHERSAVAAALFSCVATPLQALLILQVMGSNLQRAWFVAALAMALIAAAAALYQVWRGGKGGDGHAALFEGRAFQPGQALVFSVTVTALVWSAAWLHANYGTQFALAGIAVGALADAHSAVASAAALALRGAIDEPVARLAIWIAFATNTLSKLVLARISGGSAYARRLSPTLLLALVAAYLLVVAPR